MKMRTFAAIALAFTLASEADAGPTAREIMDKVALARKLDGSEAVLKMSVINEKGLAREREIAMATKLYDEGKTEKRIYRFLSPPDVKGTGVLVFDYETKEDDVWIYLPALHKTRKVVSSSRSKSFMGSEFSYADLNIPRLDDFEYKLLREEDAEGETCWVIEVLPKNEQIGREEGYSKKLFWVSQTTHTIRKGLYFDVDGKEFKELRSKDVELLDPKNKRYRSMHMEMVNKKNGRKSVFISDKAVLAPDTKDEFFTTRYLERP
jgi:hypothetical protein